MSWASKAVKKAKSWVSNHKRELLGTMTFGGTEVVRQLSGYNQMKQMEQLANEQAAMQEQQAKAAEEAAQRAAGNVMQSSPDAGETSAIANILKKRSALQRSIRTQGQQRLGD